MGSTKVFSSAGGNDFTIIIMTRDRPEMVRECVASAERLPGKILLSDNSISRYDYDFPSRVEIVYRGGGLSGIEHINTCISEVKTRHFIIFHDDDLFIPEEFAKYVEFALRNPHAVAVAANAYRVSHRDGYVRRHVMVDRRFKEIGPGFLRAAYLSPLGFGIPPFPVYIYNKNIMGSLRLDQKNGGKYCDASFIFDLSGVSNIPFYSNPVMFYRLTGANDQLTFGVREYKLMYHHLGHEFKRRISIFNLYRLSRFNMLGRQVKGGLWFKLKCNIIFYYLFRAASKILRGD